MNEDLVFNNDKLIYYVIGKMGLFDKRETYYEIGLVGLIKAANTFDESKGYKFSTYAGSCIRIEILQHIRKEFSNKGKANYNTISLDEPIYSNSENKEIPLIDTLYSNVDIEEEIIKKEEKELLYKALSKLKEKELLVMNYYYGLNGYEELKQKEIAEKIGVTQTQVYRIIKKSINKIKKIIGDDKE